ncbi:PocR ligand-binding domain-containing protein [Tepidibacter aestuarii]|uniref:PocR ligand-binding domain-containing protein n=1 Tax=Tepidibacter aestuarii TaxID=2925782 RepID=UPI0020C026B1|nr:PocR ligand-binding domain-containing protein [Tepidibacter aestuarii]CAH2212232.1 Transcriptional regulator, AraC family [Tepidibacter aestuarii]
MNENVEDANIDKNYLLDVLSSFSKATGLYIDAVNNEGESYFKANNVERSEFCKFIRSHDRCNEKCKESYKVASIEAGKWEEPYFFRCHAGIVIWAVPIIIKGVSVGSIMCGQVLMWEPDEFFFEELKEFNPYIEEFETLKEKAMNLEIVSPNKTQAVADTLFIVVNYLVKRNICILENKDSSRLLMQKIRQELEDRKKSDFHKNDDYNSYLKKERKLLSYIRLGDKVKIKNTLLNLLGDLYVKTGGDKNIIKLRILELASLISRAAVDGGLDAEIAMTMMEDFNKEICKVDNIECFFYEIYDITRDFLDKIFILGDKKHISLLKKARNFIMENYSKTIKIEDVAQYLFISKSHLSRLFRKELDCTVNDYITRVRVEKAVELMKKRELSIKDISISVGFKSQSYFTKVFKKHIDVNPVVYRNKLF